MSDFFVTLVLKTNIYKSKLIVVQHFASLELEHSELNTRLYGRTLNKQYTTRRTAKIDSLDSTRETPTSPKSQILSAGFWLFRLLYC